MGSIGDCYDNAVCETFHASLKKERIYRRSCPRRGQSRRVPVHRGPVQPPAPALHPRLPLPSPVRAPPRRARDTARPNDRRHHRRQRLSPFRDRPRPSNRSRSGRDERRSRDERNPVASPTGSQGADSLIQTSTTKGKTCRPNRGRSSAARFASSRSGRERAAVARQPTPHTCPMHRRRAAGHAAANQGVPQACRLGACGRHGSGDPFRRPGASHRAIAMATKSRSAIGGC